MRHIHLSERGVANADMLDTKNPCRLQGAWKVAAYGNSALIGLLNCPLRRRVLSVDTGSIVFFDPSAELCRIQSEMFVDLWLPMPH